MRAVVATCDGCGVRIRTSRPEAAFARNCPKCHAPLASAIARAVAESSDPAANSATGLVATASAPAQAIMDPQAQAPRGRAAVVTAQAAALLVVAVVVSLALRPARMPSAPTLLQVRSGPKRAAPPPPPAPHPPARESSLDPAPAGEPASTVSRPQPPSPAYLPIRAVPPPPLASESATVADASRSVLQLPPLRLSPPPAQEGQGQAPPPSPQSGAQGGAQARQAKVPPSAPAAATGDAAGSEPRRILVRDDAGRPMVTRVYGEKDGHLVVLLPDGQISWVDGRSYTDKPFQPATFAEMRQALHEAQYCNFEVRQTPHFLIFYRCTEAFAADSGRLLESLYQGLLRKFTEWGLKVHESEFPLVAVIYGTEREFRAHNKVAPDIQAYYNILSNRIYFYETAELEELNPEIAAIRQPYTVAHEGTHQILQNIGVHPRLAKWPLWLVEGLAEYCAPTRTKKGAEWAGIGMVNALHMATINDVEEQVVLARIRNGQPAVVNPKKQRPLVQDLVTRSDLSPVEYAYAWALTHYLASRRGDDLLRYLQAMGQMPPLEEQGPDDYLRAFRDAFGHDVGKVNSSVGKHLTTLKYEILPYYFVMFEQPMPNGLLRKAALVSQSPTVIRQWLQSVESAEGAPGNWRVMSYVSLLQAKLAAEQWFDTN